LRTNVRSFLMRTVWGTLIAFFLIFLFHYFDTGVAAKLRDIRVIMMAVWVIILVNFLFQGLLWLDRRLDRSISWYYYPKKRFFLELAIALPGSLTLIFLNYFLMYRFSSRHGEGMSHQRFLYAYILIMIVMGIAVSIIIANNFFRNWRKSLLEVEKLKQEKIKTDYQALQNQLNPHFLFNNFNMLLSEIPRDPENAMRITERLSDVYRYVLESKNRETVSLAEESEFLFAIVFLHKVRFGDNLVVNLQLPEDKMEYRLPPLTLQILFENAIKHNVVSSTHPLHIVFSIEDDTLISANDIQPRKSTYSTGLGLKNIKLRYSYLTRRKILVKADDNRFVVRVPLL